VAAQIAPAAHYLFHTGVGSTPLSRLIGAHQAFFALREPAPPRVLADTGGPARALPHHRHPPLPLEVALAPPRPTGIRVNAVIKATSFSELWPRSRGQPRSGGDPRFCGRWLCARHPLGHLRVEARTLALSASCAGAAAQSGRWRSDPRSKASKSR
jgi:hypothetical protein